MRIILLGFFTLILFVPIFANAGFSTSVGQDRLSEIGERIIKTATQIAELMIEGEYTDEEIDEKLREMDNPVIRETVVEKLKEMGHDYNGEFITAYNNKLKEKEEAKKTSPFYINQQKQETKMRDLDNKLDLNGTEIYALESFVSLNDLLTIEDREDLKQIFKQNDIDFNDESDSKQQFYDNYAHIKDYEEYKEYSGIN